MKPTFQIPPLSNPKLTRRKVLQLGGMSMLAGAGFGSLLHAGSKTNSGNNKAKSVILVNLFGGPSHIDTFDMKPDAPKEIRGEFKSIASKIPGYQVCEHLPLIANRLDKTTLIRTVSHGYNSHNPYSVLTGFTGGSDRENYFAKPSDHPSMAAVCQHFGMGKEATPFHVMMPAFPGFSQGLRRAGPYGGYLGKQYDPITTMCEPTFARKGSFYDPVLPVGDPVLAAFGQTPGLSLDRIADRKRLQRKMDDVSKKIGDPAKSANLSRQQKQAYDLLTSSGVRTALDLDMEPSLLRERYGKNLYGSSLLAARRLVEAGVTFVTVNWECGADSHGGHWDMHSNNFGMLKFNLPILDTMVTALMDDLETRGLFDSTLVIVTGEMGRTPKINGSAGRDHWPQCGFCLLFGAGVKKGFVLGTSDKQAAYPVDHPVSPGDLCATVYSLLGIDSEAVVHDTLGRPTAISHGGRPIQSILG